MGTDPGPETKGEEARRGKEGMVETGSEDPGGRLGGGGGGRSGGEEAVRRLARRRRRHQRRPRPRLVPPQRALESIRLLEGDEVEDPILVCKVAFEQEQN